MSVVVQLLLFSGTTRNRAYFIERHVRPRVFGNSCIALPAPSRGICECPIEAACERIFLFVYVVRVVTALTCSLLCTLLYELIQDYCWLADKCLFRMMMRTSMCRFMCLVWMPACDWSKARQIADLRPPTFARSSWQGTTGLERQTTTPTTPTRGELASTSEEICRHGPQAFEVARAAVFNRVALESEVEHAAEVGVLGLCLRGDQGARR